MVRATPDLPVTLRCNAGEVFAFQDPGPAEDTPEGAEFNLRRDLEILHRMNLAPGSTLSARIVFSRLIDTVETTAGICAFGATAVPAWKGCRQAGSGNFERGRAKGIEALIPPRSKEEMKLEKDASVAATLTAQVVDVRPHTLLCAVCQYGGGVVPPFPDDNLPELLQRILDAPGVRIRMMPHADWMMCAPCPSRAPGCNGCVNNRGAGGLPNQLRNLRVLEKLGLTFGSVVDARELFRNLLERIQGTLEICRLHPERPSVWWTGCGANTTDSPAYSKGRALLLGRLSLSPNQGGSI